MDTVLLSRWQFGITTLFHFLFVPLTIGLSTIVAVFEVLYWLSKKPVYDKAARFWFKLQVVIFTVGVASGIALEFQFGTNWSEYSRFVGDVFGPPLAAEVIFTFFLESTFFGLLIFGRDKISSRMRAFSATMVSLGAIMSAFWILAANSWQQTPAGYQIKGGRAILVDFSAAIFNPSTFPRFWHTLDGAFMTAAFFVIGISAYFLLKGRSADLANVSMRVGLIFALTATLFMLVTGDIHAKQVAETQPVKLAAFEGLWKTQPRAPLMLVGIPLPSEEQNILEIIAPGFLSLLAYGDIDAPVRGLDDFPKDQWPPVSVCFFSFHLMIIIWSFLAILVLFAFFFRKKLASKRMFLKVLILSIPLPFLANELGWIVAEMGRQPWVVYGILLTYQAASPLPWWYVLLTVSAITLLYVSLLFLVIHLLKREISKAVTNG
ncbi:cytochrome ubiquinol oxidase subunit I [Desulfosporosinus sp. SYSU MS00001]|uniref:cytochrome ubiquinol oxidase subunit I n=1 Tax=Desulfosporosinus sp. SYSU MS00001 TaxID=3416284 RepID=UPI003CE9371D